jgi:transposase
MSGKLRPLLASGFSGHVNTTEEALTTGRRRRRHHSVFFKAEAVGACQQPGVSISAVALARGLNANLLRRWVQEAERGDAPIAIRSSRSDAVPEGAEGFVPVSLSSSPTESVIQIELRNGAKRVSLRWPASQARECALLLRALMK